MKFEDYNNLKKGVFKRSSGVKGHFMIFEDFDLYSTDFEYEECDDTHTYLLLNAIFPKQVEIGIYQTVKGFYRLPPSAKNSFKCAWDLISHRFKGLTVLVYTMLVGGMYSYRFCELDDRFRVELDEFNKGNKGKIYI